MSDILTQEEIDALLNAAPDIQRAAEEKPPAPVMEAVPATSIEQDLELAPSAPPPPPEPSFSPPPAAAPTTAPMWSGGEDDTSFIDEDRVQFGSDGAIPIEHAERQRFLEKRVKPALFGPIGYGDDGGAGDVTNLELILDTQLLIRCELGRANRRIKEILEMGSGSVIELNKLAGEAVDLLVGDRFFSKGEVVVIDQSFGVRVTDILGIEERIEILH